MVQTLEPSDGPSGGILDCRIAIVRSFPKSGNGGWVVDKKKREGGPPTDSNIFIRQCIQKPSGQIAGNGGGSQMREGVGLVCSLKL